MLTAERLREVVNYDPNTGLFAWRNPSPWENKGWFRGADKGNGRHRIVIDGKRYMSNRLAWLYIYGVWPEHEIDHVNRIKSDDRIANLRQATPSQNSANRPAYRDGLKGVHWDKERKLWRSQIWARGKRHQLGRFATEEEAHAAYCEAAHRLHGDFANTGSLTS